MGGVRRERNQIIHLLSVAGRPMKPLSTGDSGVTTINDNKRGQRVEFLPHVLTYWKGEKYETDRCEATNRGAAQVSFGVPSGERRRDGNGDDSTINGVDNRGFEGSLMLRGAPQWLLQRTRRPGGLRGGWVNLARRPSSGRASQKWSGRQFWL